MVIRLKLNRKEANIDPVRVHFDATMTRLQAADFISVYMEQNPSTIVMVWGLNAWLVIDELDVLDAMKRGETADNIRVVVEGTIIKLIQG